MKYGDFASLVQLGVGLHAGTALLQIYGDIGLQPFERSLARLRKLARDADDTDPFKEEVEVLDNDFDIFRIQLFNEFKKYVVINFIAAALLIMILVVISYKTDDRLSIEMSIFFTAASVLPAIISLVALWVSGSEQLRPLKARADRLEERALGTR
jgi:hypothetical protein